MSMSKTVKQPSKSHATPTVGERSQLTPEQLAHRDQMDQRPLAIERQMQHLVAHTVLPGRNRSDFIGPVDGIDKVVDVILAKTWKKLPNGRVRAGSRFCIYKTSFDPATGEIIVGGEANNPFAKDLSCRPFVGARGKVFDFTANAVNFENAMILDGQMEAAARDSRLQAGEFSLGGFLLGFHTEAPPTYEETPELRDDVFISVQDDAARVSSLLQAPFSGTITDIAQDVQDGTQAVLINNGGHEEAFDLPSFVRIDVAVGNEVKEGDPIGAFTIYPLSWSELEEQGSKADIDILLRRQWAQRYNTMEIWLAGQKTNVYTVPYEYVSREQAKRSVAQLRDVSGLLGRTLYDMVDPSTMCLFNEDEASIRIVDTHGDSDRLVGVHRGVRYDFRGVRPDWCHYFESLSEPK